MVMAWPSALVSTHKAILAAIKSEGRDRFEEAAERIVAQKTVRTRKQGTVTALAMISGNKPKRSSALNALFFSCAW